ncbi:MAG: hypothetical protein HYT08_04510 [Candidatus Levybacteria bacterium]|nr:hypothetical protein [Candidatus Levybacteria bacterium]
MNKIKNLFLSILGIIFLFSLFSLSVSISQKASAQTTVYIEGSIPSGWAPCNSSSCPANPFPGGTCANGSGVGVPVGACGWPACEGGSAWQRYQLASSSTCYANGPLCYWVFQLSSNVCSLGDKCTAAQPYLNYGYPNCETGACQVGGIYKTCCSGSNIDGACVQSNIDNISPPEGSCPSGTSTVMCLDSANTGSTCEALFGCNNCNVGGGVYCTNSACGASACQAIFPQATPVPTTSPTGAIQGYHVEMPALNAYPMGAKTALLDGGNQTTDNPYGTGSQFASPAWNNISAGNHTVSINSVSTAWGAGYTLCYNVTNCHNSSPTAGTSVTVNVPSGGYADLWWHYFPPPTASINIVGSTTRTIGENITFNANANDGNSNLQSGEIFWSTNSSPGSWNSLGSSAISGSTATFSKTWNTSGRSAGSYVVVVNASSKYSAHCTGNPFQLVNDVSCGPNGASTNDTDVVVVNLIDPVPTYSVSGRVYIDNGKDINGNNAGTYGDGFQTCSGACDNGAGDERGYTTEVDISSGLFADLRNTNSVGYYIFSSLPSAIYNIYPIIGSGYSCSPGNTCNRNINVTANTTVNFGLVPAPTNTPTPTLTPTPTTVPGYTISGNVFNDTNRNGIQDCSGACDNGSGDETNYSGASLTLRTGSCTGTSLGSRTSGSTSPGYSYTGLTNGTTYYVVLTRPSGKDITTPNATLCSGSNYYVTRTIAGTNVTLHWGLANPITPTPTLAPTATPIPASVWGKYFADDGPGACYGNRVQDCGEPPIVSQGIYVQDGDCWWAPSCNWSSVTDSSGNYSISGPASGRTYRYNTGIPTDYSSLGYVRDRICKPFTPGCDIASVPEPPWWFYLSPPVQIDVLLEPPPHDIVGNIFVDSNGNGVQDCSGTCNDGPGDEVKYTQERIIELRTGSCTGTLVGDYTARGSYSFRDLSPQTYYIIFPLPSGYTLTTPASATICSGSNYFAERVMPQLGGITQDWGIQPIPTNTPTPTPVPNNITGIVFVDTNRNGVQNVGEVGYPGGAKVDLLDCRGSCTQLDSKLTDPNGQFAFNGLAAATYSVFLNRPLGYTLTTVSQRNLTLPPDGTANFGIAANAFIHGTFVDKSLNILTTNIGQNVTINKNVVVSSRTNGTYSFEVIPATGFSATATVPVGYTVLSCIASIIVNGVTQQQNDCWQLSSYQPVNPVSNIDLPNAFDDANIWFMYFSPKTISGNVFVDTDKDGFKDATESNYTGGGITISSGDGTVNVNQAAGTYQITNLDSGTYFVSYSGIPAGYAATFPVPTSYSATVGTGCTWSPNTIPPLGNPTNASCDVNNNIRDLNFGITDSQPWIQTEGGDIRVDDGFVDNIPPSTGPGGTDSCPTSSDASVPPASGSPGVIFSGDSIPDFGQGQASAPNWQIGDPTFGEIYIPPNPGELSTSYNSMMTKINQAGLTPTTITSITDITANGLYLVNGDLLVNSDYNFGANQNYVILVNGNMWIGGNIDVPTGSTAVFIVKGNTGSFPSNRGITVAPATTRIEGYFSTDWNFIIPSASACALGPDTQLIIEGAVVVNAVTANGGQFILERDLCSGNVCPAVVVIVRPDFVLNAPAILMRTNALRQEVAP